MFFKNILVKKSSNLALIIHQPCHILDNSEIFIFHFSCLLASCINEYH